MPLITLARLRRFVRNGRLSLFRPLVDNIRVLDKFAIDTPLRVSHFLGQCAVETWYFTTLTERGNTARYKGRGYIQITGRNNYAYYGSLVHLDLLAEPDRAAEPDLAVRLACLYWDKNHLNRFADADDARKVSRGVNRGNPYSGQPANNESERIQYTNRALNIFVPEPDHLTPDSKGPAVAALRGDLNLIGYTLSHYAEQEYDQSVESSVRDFQENTALPVTGLADLETLDVLARAATQHEEGSQAPVSPAVLSAVSAISGLAAGYLIGNRVGRSQQSRLEAQPLLR